MGLRAGMVAAQGTWAHGAQGTRRTEYSIKYCSRTNSSNHTTKDTVILFMQCAVCVGRPFRLCLWSMQNLKLFFIFDENGMMPECLLSFERNRAYRTYI